MYMQLLRKLLAEIRAEEWYSIIATEEVSKVLQGHDLNAHDTCMSVAQAISFWQANAQM